MPKRKTNDDGSKGVSVQAPNCEELQALAPAISASNETIGKRNARESTLLRLPAELRDRIFRHVAGDQFIHIAFMRVPRPDKDRKGKIYYCLCRAERSEQVAYKEFKEGYRSIPDDYSEEYYTSTFRDRHADCRPWADNVRLYHSIEGYDRRPMVPRLSLEILRACRQTYQEANFVLWTANTFCFEGTHSLKHFVHGLSATQKRMLKAIHINKHWLGSTEDQRSWTTLLTRAFLHKLSGLQTLHTTFIAGDETDLTEPLCAFKMLPLKEVTAVFADSPSDLHPASHKPERWTLETKRRYAEQFCAMVLDSKGHENFAAKCREEAKRKKISKEEVRMREVTFEAESEAEAALPGICEFFWDHPPSQHSPLPFGTIPGVAQLLQLS